jgi:hypothetical protein
MKPLTQNRLGVFERFQTSLYPELALVPNMPWLGTVAPAIPDDVRVKDGKLTWKSPSSGNIRSFSLYKQNADGWKLVGIIDAATTTVTIDPGTYALCAVDNLANESAGVVISIT